MLMEDWNNGCCRLWAPISEDTKETTISLTPFLRGTVSWKSLPLVHRQRDAKKSRADPRCPSGLRGSVQQLALRLIRAVETFDPDKGVLLILAQLKYELLSCKTPRRLYGITTPSTDFRAENSSHGTPGAVPSR